MKRKKDLQETSMGEVEGGGMGGFRMGVIPSETSTEIEGAPAGNEKKTLTKTTWELEKGKDYPSR